MEFKTWLEMVTPPTGPGSAPAQLPLRPPIKTNQPLQIRYIDPEDDWMAADEVEQIASKVRVRFNSTKHVSLIAVVGEEIIGGVAESYQDVPDQGMTYDFDVVVDPQWQGYQNVGLRLIEGALQNAHHLGAHLISVHVTNQRLVPILVNKYGFDGETPSWQKQPEEQRLHKFI